MISKNLGIEIDVHTGGVDNLFRHHVYTLAVMQERIRRLAAVVFERRKKASGRQGAGPAAALLADIEKAMNADLDYASAFDAVAWHLERAAQAGKNGAMTAAGRERLRRAPAKADAVLGVLGLAGNIRKQGRYR